MSRISFPICRTLVRHTDKFHFCWQPATWDGMTQKANISDKWAITCIGAVCSVHRYRVSKVTCKKRSWAVKLRVNINSVLERNLIFNLIFFRSPSEALKSTYFCLCKLEYSIAELIIEQWARSNVIKRRKKMVKREKGKMCPLQQQNWWMEEKKMANLPQHLEKIVCNVSSYEINVNVNVSI